MQHQTINSDTITTTLAPMTADQLADWTFITDALPGHGPVRGFTLHHPHAGLLGVILHKGRLVHAEWHHPALGDTLHAGTARRVHHAVAQILAARETAGHPVPADPAAPTAPLKPAVPAVYDGDDVTYHGLLVPLRNRPLIAEWCACDADCGLFQLATPGGDLLARHVHPHSLTPITAPADLTTAA